MKASNTAVAPAEDLHAEWSRAAAAVYARIDAQPIDDEALNALTREADVFEQLIADTPAATLAGVAEQLRAALRFGGLYDGMVPTTAVRSALAALVRIAAA